MPEPIECRGPEDLVGREGIAPLGEVQVAGDDDRCALVTFADQIMEVFVVRQRRIGNPTPSFKILPRRVDAINPRSSPT